MSQSEASDPQAGLFLNPGSTLKMTELLLSGSLGSELAALRSEAAESVLFFNHFFKKKKNHLSI